MAWVARLNTKTLYPRTVTHPSTNRARHRATTLIDSYSLPLSVNHHLAQYCLERGYREHTIRVINANVKIRNTLLIFQCYHRRRYIELYRIDLFSIYRYAQFLRRPGRGAEYCDQFICLPVCLSVCLSLCVSVCLSASISLEPLDRSPRIFCADPLWPWFGPRLAALRYVMYFRFYG